MKQLVTIQQSFDKGIDEKSKQNSIEQPFNSALLISNYNPNIEKGSLIKRKGYFPIPIPQLNNLNNTLINEINSPLINQLIINQDIDVVTYGMIKQHTPADNKMYYAILRIITQDINNPSLPPKYYLKILTYNNYWRTTYDGVAQHTDNLAGPDWYNAFNEDFYTNYIMAGVGVMDFLVNRGIYMEGIYGSTARYGEELLISTRPGPNRQQTYYPLYIFKYVDYTKANENNKLLNGINKNHLYNKDKARHIVLPNSLDLNDKVVFSKYEYSSTDNSINVLDFGQQWTGNNSDKYFEIMMFETDYASLNYEGYNYDIYNDGEINVINDNFEIIKNYELSPDIHINELNKLKVNKWLSVVPEKQYVKLPEGSYTNISIDIPKYTVFEEYLKDIVIDNNTTLNTITNIDHQMNVEIIDSDYCGVSFIDDTNTVNNDLNKKPVPNAQINPDGKRYTIINYVNKDNEAVPNYQGIRERVKSKYVTLPIYYVDYKSLGIPRPWVAGEEIPIAVTVTINGVEQVIGFNIYKVGWNYSANIYINKNFTNTWDVNLKPFYLRIDDPVMNAYNGFDYTLPNICDVHNAIHDNKNMDIVYGTTYGYIDNANYKPLKSINNKQIYTGEVITCVNPNYYKLYSHPSYYRIPNSSYDEDYEYAYHKIYSKLYQTYYNNIHITPYIYNEINVGKDFNYVYIIKTSNTESKYKFKQKNIYHKIIKRLGNLVAFNVRINASKLDELLSMGVTDINIYVSAQGDESNYRSVGVTKPTKPSTSFYSKPKVKEIPTLDKDISNIDLTGFRLFKTFVIQGDDQGEIDYRKYKGEATSTNKWTFHKVNNQVNSIVAVSKNNKYYGDTPDFWLWDFKAEGRPLLLQGSGKYWDGTGAGIVQVLQGRVFLLETYDKDGQLETGYARYSVAIGDKISKNLFYDEDKIKIGSRKHTASVIFREQWWIFNDVELYRFIIPNIADTSTWELADNIKGQGTISQKHVAVTPYGVVFANENGLWMSDGGKPENLTDLDTSIMGYYKTMISNNVSAEFINIPIAKYLYNNDGFNEYVEVIYDQSLDEIQVISYGIDYPVTADYNYDNDNRISSNNECTVRLIFNLKHKNWRVEKAIHGTTPIPLWTSVGFRPQTKQTSRFGTYSFNDDGIVTGLTRYDFINLYSELNRINNRLDRDFYIVDNMLDINTLTYQDIIGEIVTHELGDGKNDFMIHSNILEITPKVLTQYTHNHQYLSGPLRIITNSSFTFFVTNIITRSYGNINQPGWETYVYPTINRNDIISIIDNNSDPIFAFEQRNRETIYDERDEFPYPIYSNNKWWEDIVYTNFRHKQFTGTDRVLMVQAWNPYASKMETPGGATPYLDIQNLFPLNNIIRGVARESLILISPRIQFRNLRYYFRSKLAVKVKSFLFKLSMNKRRI